jgi:hypothetical protein
MINSPTGEAQAGLNILGLQIRQFQQYLFGGQPTGQEIENVGYADSHPADAGASAALLRIDRDSLRQIHHATLLRSIMPDARRQGTAVGRTA